MDTRPRIQSPIKRAISPLRASLTAASVALVCASCSPGVSGDTVISDQVRPQSTESGGVAAPVIPAGQAFVVFGADTVVAEVARTTAERARGLMFRDEVPDGTGMLFVFDNVARRTFHMENTFVDLDIAFIDENYTVFDIQQMNAESTDLTESDGSALMALEVRQGWFADQGIEVGIQAQIFFGR